MSDTSAQTSLRHLSAPAAAAAAASAVAVQAVSAMASLGGRRISSDGRNGSASRVSSALGIRSGQHIGGGHSELRFMHWKEIEANPALLPRVK